MSRANVDALLTKLTSPAALVDMFYPVGSYYETSDTTFDPNTAWGGTWALETEGQVHVSAGTNYVVNGAQTDTTDGGAATVALNDVKYLPAHTHGSKTLTGHWKDNSMCSINSVNKLGNREGIVTLATTKSTQYYTTSGRTTTSNQIDQVTINATHEHNSVGSGTAHENMPPYIIVNRWHRTA